MKSRAFAAALACGLLLTGCGSVKIAQINADPSRYRNRDVHVSGTVVAAAGVLGTGGYQLQDGTGRIYLVSRAGVPSRGARVEVTGTVIPGVQVIDRPVGVSIREKSHRLK